MPTTKKGGGYIIRIYTCSNGGGGLAECLTAFPLYQKYLAEKIERDETTPRESSNTPSLVSLRLNSSSEEFLFSFMPFHFEFMIIIFDPKGSVILVISS